MFITCRFPAYVEQHVGLSGQRFGLCCFAYSGVVAQPPFVLATYVGDVVATLTQHDSE